MITVPIATKRAGRPWRRYDISLYYVDTENGSDVDGNGHHERPFKSVCVAKWFHVGAFGNSRMIVRGMRSELLYCGRG